MREVILILLLFYSSISLDAFHLSAIDSLFLRKHRQLLCKAESFDLVTAKDANRQYVISDLKKMSNKEAFRAMSESSTIKSSLLIEDVEIAASKPTINKYIIANPKGFLVNPQASKLYMNGEIDDLDESTPLQQYMSMLPVIYIAENHPDYGTLGWYRGGFITRNQLSIL
jgi:hypothetical protein